jgi:hypothetical protein
MNTPNDCVIVTKDSTTVLGGGYFVLSQSISKEVTLFKAKDGTVAIVIRPQDKSPQCPSTSATKAT